MSAHETLKKARGIIEDPANWCQGAAAKGPNMTTKATWARFSPQRSGTATESRWAGIDIQARAVGAPRVIPRWST